MTRLSMEQHTGEINVCSMVQDFKGIDVRNQFKLLSFPFPWTAAGLRDFMQLERLRSLESLELWDSDQAFLEAIDSRTSGLSGHHSSTAIGDLHIEMAHRPHDNTRIDLGNQPPLRYLRIAVAASTGPLTSEMVSTHFDRYERGLEDVGISLEGPQDVMEQPWVKKLVQWFDGQNNRRHEQYLADFTLSQCRWG
ncbi:hypothetical protein EC957_007789 [Mortierella hygrophila]|uniref:Uncharacterized protein n=1 Tax=Mortierella hygrophila TaxID=979708 RepID=A0A9P6EWR7_9FUNG|nr:hypothetical protein EC957_007789 [Mortierella hygrophila]